MGEALRQGTIDSTAEPRPRRPGGVRLGSLAGIEVRADWSLLIIFGLIAYSLGLHVLPDWHPQWRGALVWATALFAAAVFLLSVLLHELAHALVGRFVGVRVRRITLFLFGGIAHMEDVPKTPRAEALMVLAGPLTSVILGVSSIMLGLALSGDAMMALTPSDDPERFLEAMQQVGPLATLLLWVGPINLALALFNMVPGFPLDGGRVLRSILWAITHDFEKATRWAAGVGQVFGWALMGLGVLNLFAGALLQGVWLMLIGWFLNRAAQLSYEQVLQRHALGDVSVRRVMSTQVDRVSPSLNLDELVTDHLMASDQSVFPVETPEGQLLGLVAIEHVRGVPRSQWPSTTVEQVMARVETLAALDPDAPADVAFDELLRRDVEQLPILDRDRHLLGLLRRRDLLRWVALQRPAPTLP